MPNPTNPAQRSETRTEWRNVYRDQDKHVVAYYGLDDADELRGEKEAEAARAERIHGIKRIAVEEITITRTITRHPLGGTERE